jgi:hypothetical protein
MFNIVDSLEYDRFGEVFSEHLGHNSGLQKDQGLDNFIEVCLKLKHRSQLIFAESEATNANDTPNEDETFLQQFWLVFSSLFLIRHHVIIKGYNPLNHKSQISYYKSYIINYKSQINYNYRILLKRL